MVAWVCGLMSIQQCLISGAGVEGSFLSFGFAGRQETDEKTMWKKLQTKHRISTEKSLPEFIVRPFWFGGAACGTLWPPV